ncbi:MAG: agmatinase [Patescibacteria group bacterium]
MSGGFAALRRQKRTPFLAGGEEYGPARVVMFGAPMDWTSSFRPGSRFGPAAIREASEGIEEYSVYRGRSLLDGDAAFFDAGDLVLPYGNVAESLRSIGEAVGAILADGKLPLLLGGEHLVTYAAVREVLARHPDLCVVQFDAHADLRPDYLGERMSHASVMRLLHETLGDGRIFQIGIRSADRDEMAYAAAHTILCRGALARAAAEAARLIAGRPVYVTLDIDVLDPAHAPGTGTPECGGPTSAEMIEVFEVLSGMAIAGFDLVEVAPGCDPSARTALLAAVLVREALLLMMRSPG